MANWGFWKITDEQAEAIRNGNVAARNRFYFDNLSKIRSIAWNYMHAHSTCYGLFYDLLNNLYVDLSVFEWCWNTPVKNGRDLTRFVKRSFSFCPFGGIAYLKENNPKLLCDTSHRVYFCELCPPSLDAPVYEGNPHDNGRDTETLASYIPARVSPFDNLEKRIEDIKQIVLPFLSARQAEYFALYIDGYRPAVIGDKMGVRHCHTNTYYKAMCKTLQKRKNEVFAALAAHGYYFAYS